MTARTEGAARHDVAALASVAAAFATAIFDKGPGADLVPIAGATTCLLFGLFMWVIRLGHQDRVIWSRLHVAVAIFVGLLVLNYFTSSVAENTLYFGCMFGAFALTFVLCGQLSESVRERLFVYLLLIGAFSACWGVGEFVVTLDRSNGPVIDPNVWAAMNNLLFLGLVARIYAKGRITLLEGALLFVYAAAVAVSYSRLGAFILVAATAFIVVVGLFHVSVRRCSAIIALCLIGAFGTVESMLMINETEVRDRTSVGPSDTGWRERGLQWRAGLNMAADHPMGVGLGTFRARYPSYRDPREYRTVGNYVHNDYIQIAAEGGLPLALMVVGFAGFLSLRLILETRAAVGGNRDRLPAVCLVVAMGSTFAHALMNFPLYQIPNQMLLGIHLACLAGLSGWLKAVPAPDLKPALLRTAAGAGVLLVVFSLWADVFTERVVVRADGALARIVRASESAHFETILILRSVRSGNSLNHFALATLYRQSADRLADPNGSTILAAAAAEQYVNGLERNPFHYAVSGYLADLLSQYPSARMQGVPHAKEIRRAAAERARSKLPAHLLYARHLPPAARYDYLREHAVPWLDQRVETTRGDRLEIIRFLRDGAEARGDRALLETLLASLEEELRFHGWKTGERARRAHLCVGTWRATLGC